METKLYEDLKFCWKAGYKLNQIKEYCNTTLSIDELQTEFKIMWENELQAWKLVKVLDDMLDDISNMSLDELIDQLRDAPDSGVGYAISGVEGW